MTNKVHGVSGNMSSVLTPTPVMTVNLETQLSTNVVTLDQSCSLTYSGMELGDRWYLTVIQDATGGRSLALPGVTLIGSIATGPLEVTQVEFFHNQNGTYATVTGGGTTTLPAGALTNSLGGWDAATNTPTITSGVGNTGDFYEVIVAGNTLIDGISDWAIGDLIWRDDTTNTRKKIDNTNVALVPQHTGRTTWVDPRFGSDTLGQNRNPVRPYRTIAQAMANISAAPGFDSDIDTIHVYPGEITEDAFTCQCSVYCMPGVKIVGPGSFVGSYIVTNGFDFINDGTINNSGSLFDVFVVNDSEKIKTGDVYGQRSSTSGAIVRKQGSTTGDLKVEIGDIYCVDVQPKAFEMNGECNSVTLKLGRTYTEYSQFQPFIDINNATINNFLYVDTGNAVSNAGTSINVSTVSNVPRMNFTGKVNGSNTAIRNASRIVFDDYATSDAVVVDADLAILRDYINTAEGAGITNTGGDVHAYNAMVRFATSPVPTVTGAYTIDITVEY